jgi:tRNA pseudouridine55 synthase
LFWAAGSTNGRRQAVAEETTMPREEISGLLVVNKPRGMTSREAVDCVQDWFPGSRPGHAGTLDPLATGVLLVALGKATRLLEYIQAMRKVYRTTLHLGARSVTDDAEGPITPTPDVRPVPVETLRATLQKFLGEQEQVPPAYAAVKVQGRRAWKAARQYQAVQLAPRRIVIYRIELLDYCWPRAQLEVECGRGTYIRALARDLGEALGCGAYVEELTRLRIGHFCLEQAVPLTVSPEEARAALLPIAEAVAELPRFILADHQRVQRLCQGQRLRLPHHLWSAQLANLTASEVAVFDEQSQLVAIAHWDQQLQELAPTKVLATG